MACVAPAALVVLAFWPALGADFVRWDDPTLVTENPRIRGLTADNLAWMFTTPVMGHYQPLTWISYALDWMVWGLDPRGFHLTNVLIHAANTALVFALARRLIAPWPRAGGWAALFGGLVAAGAWGLHPLRVESVAWVTERRDVLSVLFMLLAASAYLRAVTPGEAALRSRPWHRAAVALLALSLLAKAWGMSFFVLLLILDFAPLRRIADHPRRWLAGPARRVVVQKWPFAALGAAAAVGAALSQHTALATKSLEQWGVIERAVQACYGLLFYVLKTLAPADLSPLYELPKGLDPGAPLFLLSYVFVAALIGVALWGLRRAPAFSAAALAYAVTLAPVLGVLQSGEQFVADRYSYVALIGWMIVLGWLASRAWRSASAAAGRGLLLALPAVLLAALLVRATVRQSGAWADTESLWRHAAAVEERTGPTGGLVFSYLGSELERQGRTGEAIRAHARALEVDPDLGRSWFSLGNLLRRAGEWPRAEEALREAARTLPQAYMARVNLGNLYLFNLDRAADAIEQYRLAVADVEAGGRRPLSTVPYLALGVALRHTGDLDGARRMLSRAAESDETRQAALKELADLPPAAP
ncbi:MAG: tetratricopeptide repeat protein [Phycisphaerae bacterium]|nr:tetratricopeptide repeat protein [Phycisphaerae bacterium]